jgi:hypothetical protein
MRVPRGEDGGRLLLGDTLTAGRGHAVADLIAVCWGSGFRSDSIVYTDGVLIATGLHYIDTRWFKYDRD